MLGAAFAMKPGQHQRDQKADAERDDDEPHRWLWPGETVGDDIGALEEGERRGAVG